MLSSKPVSNPPRPHCACSQTSPIRCIPTAVLCTTIKSITPVVQMIKLKQFPVICYKTG
jgi:hypothetical protein